jgi:hypothetical protein
MLVMNVLPLPDLDAFFSDAIVNRFRLRPAPRSSRHGPAFPYGPEDSELVFSFSFEAPQSRDGGAPVQDGWCTSPSGARTRFRVQDDEGGRGGGGSTPASARTRSSSTCRPSSDRSRTMSLAFRDPGENSVTNANALGLVVEVDRELLQRGVGRCSAWSRAHRLPVVGPDSERPSYAMRPDRTADAIIQNA